MSVMSEDKEMRFQFPPLTWRDRSCVSVCYWVALFSRFWEPDWYHCLYANLCLWIRPSSHCL